MYQQIKNRLRQAGIYNPDLEARVILKHVLAVSDSDLIAGTVRAITAPEKESLDSLVDRRFRGEPLSRILGEREFWGLPFTVTPAVLDPRPDTETLVEAALGKFQGNPPAAILDLGTGSACILVALLREWPQARGTGIDISPEALAVAEGNARRNDVAGRARFVRGNWTDSTNERFDLIVANPPYIPSGDIPGLQPEVRDHDPIPALDGGADGLDAYKAILKGLKKLMHRNSAAFFEVGISQIQYVARLAEDSGFRVNESYVDMAGIPRVLEIGPGEI